MMSKKYETYPVIEEIVNGWAALGDGWAVHAPTKEEVIEKYNERKKFYDELDQRPMPDQE
jgi:hypothetical protein